MLRPLSRAILLIHLVLGPPAGPTPAPTALRSPLSPHWTGEPAGFAHLHPLYRSLLSLLGFREESHGGPDLTPLQSRTLEPDLGYSTYLGGSAGERVEPEPPLAVAVDGRGFTYLAGSTESVDFPVTPGALFPTAAGGGDAFLARFDPAGRLDYATYLGGSGRDAARAVAVDGEGLVWLAGSTGSPDLPTTPDALQSAAAGGSDAFLAALDLTAGQLVYSTYLGGGADDAAAALDASQAGRVCLAGSTASADFPVTAGAFDATLEGLTDLFASCLQARSLEWSTLAGGPGRERAAALLSTTGGALWVAASSEGGSPLTPGAPSGGGGWDAWLFRLSPDGQTLEYSAGFGGSSDDVSGGLAPSAAGGVWLAGATASRDLPSTPGALSSSHRGGEWDWFVAGLEPGGTGWTSVTYLGGVGDDGTDSLPPVLASDVRGNLHLFSASDGPGFPTTGDALARQPAGGSDAVYARLNAAGDLLYATYLGGSGAEAGRAVAADSRGGVRLAGLTDSPDFPLKAAHQPSLAGSSDVFLAELDRPLDSLLLLASTHVNLKTGVTIQAGDVAVNLPGGVLDLEAEVDAPAGFRLSADLIRLKPDSRASANLFFNQLDNGSSHPTAARVTPIQLPLLLAPPAFEPPQDLSGPDLTVEAGTTRSLAPGPWGRVVVEKEATLLLEGGVYDLLDLDLDKDSRMLAQQPVRVRVSRRVKSGDDVRIGPAGGDLTAADLLVFAAGPLEDFEWSIDLGSRNRLEANFYASPAGFSLGKESEAEGSFFGGRVQIQPDCSLTVNSAWADPVPPNQPPQAADDDFELDEDETTVLPVLANDSDADGDLPVVTGFTDPSHGSLTLALDGTLRYQPEADYFGADQFDYQAGDGRGGEDSATVQLTILPVNDLPVARDDTVQTDEDTPLAAAVLDNDSDVDGDPLSVTAAGPAQHGVVSPQADGTVLYQPSPDYFGPDSFPYAISDGQGGTASASVEVTVLPVNDPPQAVDDAVALDEDSSVLISPLSNDFDVDGDALVLVAFGDPAHGTLQLQGSDTLVYVPEPDFSGSDGFSYTVGDGQATSQGMVSITVQPVNDPPRVMLQATPLSGTAPLDVQFQASASDPDGDTISFSWEFGDGATAGDSAEQTHTYLSAGTFTAAVTASDGTLTDRAEVTIEVMSGLPPDPALVAPPLDRTVSTTLDAATGFLYGGPDPIQTGVTPGTIEPIRAAVLRGRVLDRMNSPLPGVTISVLNHPELGQTLSRADGRYDLAVNGGGFLTLDFRKEGFLPAQRQTRVPWRDYRQVDDLVMIQPDSEMTVIDLSQPQLQVHRANPVTDQDGPRTSTLFFPAGTTAELELPDGSTQPISSLSVRATEFTVGENGPEAMPAELPPTSGYTYAVALTVDEALAAGADSVRFSQPVPLYVENFLGFPTGTDVPLGNYDLEQARWVPYDNGRVIEILSEAGGLAELDVDGSGGAAGPAALAALGITDAERQQLAATYAAGQSLWRSPIPHFCFWDANWGASPPNNAIPPALLLLLLNQDDPCEDCGSTIDLQNQAGGQAVDVVGSPFGLAYRSDRVRGRRADNSVDIRVSGASLPPTLKRIDLQVTIAGQVFTQSFPPDPNQTVRFEWDGRDVYGRLAQGRQTGVVRLAYAYDGVYGITERFGYNGNGATIELGQTRDEVLLLDEQRVRLGVWDALGEGLGGWTLDAHHRLDVAGRTLYLGNGDRVSSENVAEVIDTTLQQSLSTVTGVRDVAFAPDGSLYVAEGGPGGRVRRLFPDGSIVTVVGGLTNPSNIALAPDGSLYVADGSQHRVFRVAPGGSVSVAAGTGTPGYSGDGGPAHLAQLALPTGIEVAPDGTLFIAEFNNHTVRRVSPDGIVSTVAGDGTFGTDGDGGPARDARLRGPTDVALGPDGSLFVSDSQAQRVRRITPGGIITTVAGNGLNFGAFEEGVPATQTRLFSPIGLAVDPDGNLYLSEGLPDNDRVRVVGPDGLIFTAVGSGRRGSSGDGGASLLGRLNQPRGLSVAADGSLYLADSGNVRLRRSAAGIPGFRDRQLEVPSPEGSELFVFDSHGRHLRTLNPLTRTTVHEFTYDAEGRLAAVTDRAGNVLTVERNAATGGLALVTPFGRRTELSLDANGYLAAITNPAGETVELAYHPEGLLSGFTDPRQFTSSYTYDALGRLTRATDPLGESRQLQRLELSDGYEVVETAPSGLVDRHQVRRLPGGRIQRLDRRSDLTESTTSRGAEDRFTVTRTDGTVLDTTPGPDPAFASFSPVPTHHTLAIPGGPTLEKTSSRTRFPDGSIEDVITINGDSFRHQFDAATRTITSTSPEGRQMRATLDANAQVTSVQLGNFFPRTYEYDSAGRSVLSSQGTGAEVRSLALTYSPTGDLTGITDSVGRTVTMSHDDAGRVVRETLPGGRSIEFAYDGAENLSSITPPGRPPHLFVHNALDLETRYQPPSGGATEYAYDADKRLAQVTLADGSTITNVTGPDGRLERTLFPEGTSTYQYDATGRLTGVTTPEGETIERQFQGPLLVSETWSGSVSGSVAKSYDAGFRLLGHTVNGGSSISFGYDRDGLLVQAGDQLLQRDAGSGVLAATSLDQFSDSWQYNGFAEVAGYSSQQGGNDLYSYTLTRNQAGQITEKTETVLGQSRVLAYGYDVAGFLATVHQDGVLLTEYEYDLNGNRTRVRTASADVAASYDDQDRLVASGDAAYAFDPLGQLQSRTTPQGTTLYSYDSQGNLTSVDLPDGTVIEYVVDAHFRRIGKLVDGVLERRWLYGDDLNPLAELDSAGNVSALFGYGSRVHVPDFVIRGGQTFRIVSDHLGSPRLVVNAATGQVVQRMLHDAFGRVLEDTNPGFQPFGFAGGLYDHHTGLVRFGARDYDPEAGRWTAKDPIRFDGDGANLYAYALNSPVNFYDPTGLSVGEPGFWESFIPVWGSGRQAINDFQCGRYFWGTFNTAMALSDFLLVGSLFKTLATKGLRYVVKFGSHRYGTVNQWYRRTRQLPRGSGPVHHWLIHNNGRYGSHISPVIKNQPWNLNQVASRQLHDALHGKGPMAPLSLAERWWYGHPHWAKWAEANLAGDLVNQFRDKSDCGCN